MTLNETTYCFKKETNSLTLHFTDALRGSTPLSVNNKKITAVVSYTLNKLIKKDAVKYKNAILSLSRFSVTFTYNPEKQSSLKIESHDGKIVIHLKKLSEKATAVLNSIPQNQQPKVISASQPAQPKIATAKTTKPLLQPIVQPTIQVASLADTTTAISTTPIVVIPPIKERTPDEQLLFANMQAQFTGTVVQRSVESNEELFGSYLMNRLFENMDSGQLGGTMQEEFTLNFAQKRDIQLNKLPKGKSAEELATLQQLNATLNIAEQVKGKFEDKKVIFQPGCLSLNLTCSLQQLSDILQKMFGFDLPKLVLWGAGSLSKNITLNVLDISEDQNRKVKMQVGNSLFQREISVSAQEFVDLIECNLPK
jgi:hypothetical protein